MFYFILLVVVDVYGFFTDDSMQINAAHCLFYAKICELRHIVSFHTATNHYFHCWLF